MTQDRIALRELGERLVLLSPYRNSTTKGRTELLNLLRSEALIARFDFPSKERPQITVPAAHWQKVKFNEFRKALDSTKRGKGDYVTMPNLFVDEYLNWFSQDHRLPEHVAELAAALRAGGTMAEVYVLAKDWEQFSSQEGRDTTQHSTPNQKSSRGKQENPNWSAILVEVAVELLSASRDFRPNTKVIAGNALSRVIPRGKSRLPDIPTVGKKWMKSSTESGKHNQPFWAKHILCELIQLIFLS